MAKCLGEQDPFEGDPGGDVGTESDCEDDSPEDANGLQEVGAREEAKLRAVLTVGSFSAYVSPPSVPLAWLKRQIPQLEVALFLSLHR